MAVPRNREEVLTGPYKTKEERERFSRATGIKERRLCPLDMYASDLAMAAANRLLDDLGWDRSEIKALIYVTQSPDVCIPATACILQHRLGLPIECAAFDLNLGCSGYPYGLFVASRFLRPATADKVLLLVGDTSGKVSIPESAENIAPLFGDGVSATGLESSESAPPMKFQFRTDGEGWEAIMQPRPSGNPGVKADGFHLWEDEKGLVHLGMRLNMQGEDVFNFSVRTAPKAIKDFLTFAGLEKEEVDAFVFHQANKMINDFICKRLRLTPQQAPSSLERFGNTSSATIPVTMVDAMREDLLSRKQKLVLCGFGVGLSWGTALVETEGLVCPDFVEL